jgi:hypothetical protein
MGYQFAGISIKNIFSQVIEKFNFTFLNFGACVRVLM